MIHRPITATALTVAATLATTGCAAVTPAPVAANPVLVELVAASEPTAAEALSPAGCKIMYVTDPHPAESVPGAIKVNVKAQCGAAVPELDLSVTLLADGRPIAKTRAKAINKAHIFNQSTYIMCKNKTDEHTFQGTALGTSFEDDGDGAQKPYTQIKTGRAVPIKCGL